MTTCTVIYEVEGNTGPGLFTEAGFDLSAYISISVTVRYEQGGELNKAAVVDDAAAGTFHVVWGATDLIEGVHDLEFVFNTGTEVTRLPAEKPIKLVVRPQV